MTYTSVQEIKDYFLITSEDSGVILETLEKIRANLHPDKTKGKFPDLER
jgi:hypothetical protein